MVGQKPLGRTYVRWMKVGRRLLPLPTCPSIWGWRIYLVAACLLWRPDAAVCQPAIVRHPPTPLIQRVQANSQQQTSRLQSQAKRLLEIAQKNPVQHFAALCQRMREKARIDHAPPTQLRKELLRVAQLALEGRAYLDAALNRLRAQVAIEEHPESLHLLGEALSMWEEPANVESCQVQRTTEQAISTLERLSAHYPDHEAARVLTTLGMLHTRAHHFERAQRAYLDAIDSALDSNQSSVLYANLGEVTMLLGDLERALSYYERASLASHSPQDRALSLWGRAVVLDRLGEHDSAIESARKAMALEGGSMRVLRAEGVFFEPAYEVHIYEALGHEAKAQEVPAFASFALTEAATAYQSYLDQAGPSGAFMESARRNLIRVEKQLQHAQDELGDRITAADTFP